MLSDGFYLTCKIDNALLRDTSPFLPVIGRESMHATRHPGEDPKLASQLDWTLSSATSSQNTSTPDTPFTGVRLQWKSQYGKESREY